jgi:Uma2 family endonuclease
MAAESSTSTFAPPDISGNRLPKLYEVVGGHVVEKPPMGAFESTLASFLARWLAPYADERHLGLVVTETLFLIDPARTLKRRPDLAFVSAERWPLRRRVPRTEAWEVVPDLAIEVISLSNTADQVNEKIEDYFHSNVRQVWVIYPGTSKVYIYDSPTSVRILQVGDDLDGGTLLPGFRLPLAVLFGQEDEDQESAGN